MRFRLISKSVTLNGVMAVALRCFTEFGEPLRSSNTTASISVAEFMHQSRLLYFVVRVRCRRKVSSRSLSHLSMSFLFILVTFYRFLTYLKSFLNVFLHLWCPLYFVCLYT